MRNLQLGLISLCLLTLFACSKAPVLRTEIVQVTPPALLLRDIPEPEPPTAPATNLDLLVYAGELELALGEANNDKAALREIFKQEPPNSVGSAGRAAARDSAGAVLRDSFTQESARAAAGNDKTALRELFNPSPL